MFLPISEYLRRVARNILSYTDMVKNRLLRFIEEVKSGKYTPDQIATRSQAVDDNLRHLMKLKETAFAKDGSKVVPTNLIPKHLQGHGQVSVKDLIKDINELYNIFKQQAKNPGQHKFLPDTVKRLNECFDAINGVV